MLSVRHQWMGDAQKGCTIEDMEKFIEEFGHSLFANDNIEQAAKVGMRLSQSKNILRALLNFQATNT